MSQAVGGILRLAEQVHEALATAEQPLRRSVQVGTEQGESGHFLVLRQVRFDTTSHLLHRFALSIATDAGNRQTCRDSGQLARVAQVCFQEDLAVGNRDDVGGDVSRHVAQEGFDDGQSRERTTRAGHFDNCVIVGIAHRL